jgi:hypothetical protein
MRFARVKVLNQPEKAAHVTWVTPEEREAKGAAEAFERGEIAVRDFIAAQTPGFSAEVDGKVYHSTANGPMVEDHFPLSGFAGSAISQKELYSPAALAKYTAALKADPQHETHPLVVTGTPDEDNISTSYVERSNLTLRMGQRRFTRLTNGFSKKAENLEHAVALHTMHYNYVRVHKTLRVTPAMAAGLTERLWSIDDLIALLPVPARAPWGSKKRAASRST